MPVPIAAAYPHWPLPPSLPPVSTRPSTTTNNSNNLLVTKDGTTILKPQPMKAPHGSKARMLQDLSVQAAAKVRLFVSQSNLSLMSVLGKGSQSVVSFFRLSSRG